MRPLIYILDDDRVFAELVKANLGRAGEFKIQIFDHPLECLDAVAEAPPDILLTDLYMDEMDGVEVSRRARALFPHLPIFLLTARGEISTAIEAMKAGASEYLLKPVNVSALTTLIRKAMDQRPLLEEASSIRQSRREQFSLDSVLGQHPLMHEARTFLEGVASVRHVSVLLLGESGVGKNLAARAIHYADPAMTGQFVELNCAALPATLMEAELFGYMKGAFTDAKAHKPGLVEVADGGTLFLDEIGEMPLELQAKLLNFLESRRFRRLGGTREREVSVRIVAATNRPVDALLGGGGFREDLFYRISVASHTLPPLRDMLSDIPLLAAAFTQQMARDLGRPFEGISDEATEALKEWRWPGNVRELRNVIERAMIFASGPLLEVEDLPPLGLAENMSRGGRNRFDLPRGLALKEVEKEYIRLTLEAHSGSVQAAADSLGISRKNLWEKRRRHDLT